MHTSVEGIKRQLPPWMMQKVGANHVSKSDNVVEINCSVNKGDKITENAGNGKMENAGTDHKRETSKRKSNLDVKCEVNGRRNTSQQDGNGENIIQKKKKKSDGSRGRARKSSRKKHRNLEDPSHDICDVNPVQASSDDDLELTVEDLMAIAEQYVKDYEYKKRQEKSDRQCESKWQFPAKSESGTTPDPSCENTKPLSSSRETLCNSTPTTTGELITTSTSQPGDPAQDMLNLLLGHLLKNPLGKEEEKNKSIVEGLEFTHEFTRQSQDDLVGEETVPLMKKRSTLKDKGIPLRGGGSSSIHNITAFSLTHHEAIGY